MNEWQQFSDEVLGDPARAARVAQYRQAIEDALTLGAIRERKGFTQQDIASLLKVSQANVSRVERQRDVYLSTLASYIEALGGKLRLTAVFDDEVIEIGIAP